MKRKRNPFRKFEDNKKEDIKFIQKSDIYDAMREGYNGQLTINKTGAEIKDQISNVLMPKMTAAFEEKSAKLNDLLNKVGQAPTIPVRFYKVKLDLPFKEYDWYEMNFKEVKDNVVLFDNFASGVKDSEEGVVEEKEEIVEEFNIPKTIEEAKARKEYMEELRGLVEIAVDIKTAKVLLNFNDTQIYALTVNQSLALGF
jgi:hypothetical protein